jgi:hypothetical protein
MSTHVANLVVKSDKSECLGCARITDAAWQALVLFVKAGTNPIASITGSVFSTLTCSLRIDSLIERTGNTPAVEFCKLLKADDGLSHRAGWALLRWERVTSLTTRRYFDAAPTSVKVSSTLGLSYQSSFILPRLR